jgi:(p)ppGpp synthase/HD superfamily hydrolase
MGTPDRGPTFPSSGRHGRCLSVSIRDDGNASQPLAVANILAQWHLDSQALTAALLHDVMEDTSVTKTEISKAFGKPVADLMEFTYALRACKPGDEVVVKWRRDGKEMEGRTVLTVRK